MSATFSWGNDQDAHGRTIDATATELILPSPATDADLALLAQICENLQTLKLCFCDKITDAGLAHLTKIKQLQNLQNLNTYGTAVTAAGVAAFEAAREKAKEAELAAAKQ